jgi:hypothetical protein
MSEEPCGRSRMDKVHKILAVAVFTKDHCPYHPRPLLKQEGSEKRVRHLVAPPVLGGVGVVKPMILFVIRLLTHDTNRAKPVTGSPTENRPHHLLRFVGLGRQDGQPIPV